MKITSLLTQYLYSNQRLDLPGIGTFLLDPSAMTAIENTKQRSTVLEGVTYQHNPSLKESPELIAFISAQSGKMKALAAADLASHIQLAQQFLNIGKPFTFEGIGTLVKVQAKEYEFIPISVSTEQVKEIQQREANKSAKDEHNHDYESFLSAPRAKVDWSRPLIGLLLVCGLALAVWGGYAISKRVGNKTAAAAVDPTLLIVDTIPAKPDTAVSQPIAANYKYVLEVSPGKRAFKRYNQLRTNRWDVQLETKDSIQYKLFLLLPTNTDTTHVLDSLTVMLGRQVYIEQQN